jgi:hypothetical protein
MGSRLTRAVSLILDAKFPKRLLPRPQLDDGNEGPTREEARSCENTRQCCTAPNCNVLRQMRDGILQPVLQLMLQSVSQLRARAWISSLRRDLPHQLNHAFTRAYNALTDG